MITVSSPLEKVKYHAAAATNGEQPRKPARMMTDGGECISDCPGRCKGFLKPEAGNRCTIPGA